MNTRYLNVDSGESTKMNFYKIR